MKNYLFAITISALTFGCCGKSDGAAGTAASTPALQTAVVDTPPPYTNADPDYQEDQSGPIPSDTIVGNTGFTQRQLDSIAKHKSGPIEYLGGKSPVKPHDSPKPK